MRHLTLIASTLLLVILAACGGNSGKNISVAISGAPTTIAPTGTFTLTASVSGDGSNSGVTWSANGGGTLSNLSTTSATYTAPDSQPDPNSVIITATSIANTTKSASVTFTIVSLSQSVQCKPQPQLRGNESALTAPIAFQLEGTTDLPIFYAGSFTADGSGGITAASLDLAGFDLDATSLAVDAGSSSYSYGTDGRGCLYLALDAADAKKKSAAAKRIRTNAKPANDSQDLPTALTLSFALTSPTGAGRIIAFDSASGSIASGQMHAQTPADFSVAKLSAHYAFGAAGWAANYDRVAIAGSFTNAAGNWSNGVADENIGGESSGRLTGGEGSVNATIDPVTGRGTGHFEPGNSGDGGVGELEFTFYVVNGGDLYLISSDDSDDAGFLLAGRALSSSATSVAPNGYFITEAAGASLCESCGSSYGNAVGVSTMHATADGHASGNNPYAGAYSWTYSLDAPSGRVAFTGDSAPIAYLTDGSSDDSVSAFIVGTDNDTSSGLIFSAGTSAPNDSASSVAGAWALSSAEDVSDSVGSTAGAVTFDGTSDYAGTLDTVADGSGVPQYTASVPASGIYVVNADGTGSFGDSSTAFVTNGTVIAAIRITSPTPHLEIYLKQATEDAEARVPRR